MNHTVKNFTNRDLLEAIASPYTTPDLKRAALKERTERKNKLAK
tara:strand:- start:62 stop:193 length:132 start_codon:yes stop_codon:yes gene_type:complete